MGTPTLNMPRGEPGTAEMCTLRIEIDRPGPDRDGRWGFTLIWTTENPDAHGRIKRAQCFFAKPEYYIGRFIERCARQ